MNAEKEFRCTIKHLWRNCPKPDGWFGCFAHIRGETNDIILKGKTLINLANDMVIDVKATENPNMPGEYEVITLTPVTKTKQGLISYLYSLPGVSHDVAKKVYMEYKTKSIDIIMNTPDKLKTDLNLTDKQVSALVTGVNNVNDYNQLRTKFPQLSAKQIKYLYNNFITKDKHAMDRIKDNPYCLIEVPGITFKDADAIALDIYNISPVSPFRVNHGIVYLLDKYINNTGNLYLNLSDAIEFNKFLTDLTHLLNIGIDMNAFATQLIQLSKIKDSPIIMDVWKSETHLYPRHIYNDMNTIIEAIHSQSTGTNFSTTKIENTLKSYSKTHLQLTKEQKDAAITALSHQYSIITGGPGRGKTTMIDAICSSFLQLYGNAANIICLAPTGRAVKKLKHDTHNRYQTETIDHYLLRLEHSHEFKENSPRWIKQMHNTLFVIDESAMIDIPKAARLLNDVGISSVCFVCDIDQLLSIGPGAFMKDLIASNTVATSYLTTPLRNNGLILKNADLIKRGDTNLTFDFNEMPFYPYTTDNDAIQPILDQYQDEMNIEPNINQIALLCPMTKGPIGTHNLNIHIQSIFVPEINQVLTQPDTLRDNNPCCSMKGCNIPGTFYGDSVRYTNFRIGDRVMQTKNEPDKVWEQYKDYWNDINPNKCGEGVFNGDMGTIYAYYPGDNTVANPSRIIVKFDDNHYITYNIDAGEHEQLVLGYAITVHKAQGSEYNTIIYISPTSMLYTPDGFACRNILYTAITRAKKKACIMGSKEALEKCIKTPAPIRNSTLIERL